MKLRNKKTGEIISKIDVSQDHEGIWVMENKPRFYRTLAELNEEWEDYSPVIIDQETAKYVRHWAKEFGFRKIRVAERANLFVLVGEHTGLEEIGIAIKFEFVRDGVDPSRYYTIDELCGEEEE